MRQVRCGGAAVLCCAVHQCADDCMADYMHCPHAADDEGPQLMDAGGAGLDADEQPLHAASKLSHVALHCSLRPCLSACVFALQVLLT